MKSKEKSFQEIMATINRMPEFKRSAFQWALCHYNLMEALCAEEPPLSAEEFEKEIQKAVDTQEGS